jgi:putative ABC transport system permease protein
MIRRVVSLGGLGVRRVIGRLTGPHRGRTLVSCIGVALAVAVLVVVTGLSLGLVGGSSIQSSDVNYWIVPDDEQQGISPVGYEGARLGSVHQVSANLQTDSQIEHASPVAVQPIQLTGVESDKEAWVLALGIIPSESGYEIGGVETSQLSPGDPYYANGTYNGTWTGEVLGTPAAAELLGADRGSKLAVNKTKRELQVKTIAEQNPTVGVGEAPVVIMHLSELQQLAGTAAGDQATQILVLTNSNVADRLEDVYPGTRVETRQGLFAAGARLNSLPFAMALGAGLVALGIGITFVATMMGLELTATRSSLALLSAVGFRRRSIAIVLLAETITVAVVGGIVGVVIGAIGIVAVNAGLTRVAGLAPVGTFDPVLIGYGIAAAVLVGIVSVVYPIYIAWRTETLAELSQ